MSEQDSSLGSSYQYLALISPFFLSFLLHRSSKIKNNKKDDSIPDTCSISEVDMITPSDLDNGVSIFYYYYSGRSLCFFCSVYCPASFSYCTNRIQLNL
jgi:hypothetical protein